MFIRAANPIWFFNNLTGQVLDPTYWAFFLTNTLPYLPQNVFQDPDGVTPWADPIEFQPSGGLPNNLYFDPSLVYRIEIRQGNTQVAPLIWLIENFIPGEGSSTSSSNFVNSLNMVTNPQFFDISFISPITITTAGTYNIAPDWQLILTGTGSTTLTQVNLPGEDDLPGNPPYALQINNSGWTTAQLVQKFSSNGALFAGGSVAMSILANPSTNPQLITLNYVTSDGTTVPIAAQTLPAGVFTTLSGVNNIPASTNPDLGTAAFTEMQIILQPTGTIEITNVQFMGQSIQVPSPSTVTAPAFQEESLERQIDNEFHFYLPELAYKPVPSYLVGWDFAYNPAQFLGPTIGAQAIGANKSFYAWDQTIVFQSMNSSVTVSRDTGGAFTLNNLTSGNQVAVIQYLDQAKARKLLNQPMAVNVTGAFVTGLKLTVSLWYTTNASLPSTVGSNNSLVLTLDSNGKPATFNGTWTEVPPRNGQDAFFIGSGVSSTDYTDYSFTGWNIGSTAISNTVTFFAIVIGTAPITSIAGGEVDISSVNLVNGQIATRPAPQTEDEVLRECEFYYAKTFPKATIPAQNAGLNGAIGYVAYASNVATDGVEWRFPTPLISASPTMITYSPAAATANWYNEDVAAGSGVPALRHTCDKSVFVLNPQVGGDAQGSLLLIHLTADARLGR